MDESLVHCHRGCEFEYGHHTLFLCVFFRFYIFYQFIYLFDLKYIIHNYFKPFGLMNIALMTANKAYPIELMHSVASLICVFVFDSVPFDGYFV